MTSYILFNKTFYDHKKKCRFYAGVKYALKDIDANYYYTINNVKLPKSYKDKIFTICDYRN